MLSNTKTTVCISLANEDTVCILLADKTYFAIFNQMQSYKGKRKTLKCLRCLIPVPHPNSLVLFWTIW